MNIHNLKTVACYNSRLLLRSWMFRLFLLLLFLIIILYQVLAQTNIFYGINSGLVTLSSYFPHENAYLFTILQIVPLIFLAGTFLGKERKMDSMDTVYYRPESNADYVVGMMLGFAKTFMMMAGISLVIGMLLHIFASDSPFNFWLYPFYWLTMIFPALVFALGFSFFIHTWIRHRGLGILILLVVFGVFLFQLGKVREGLFDPFGLSLPNAFSEVTGHPGMALYLMQRVCWLLVGMGFAGLTVLMFQRLPNRPVSRKRVMIVAVGCLGLGVLFGGVVYMARENVECVRELYAETYNKYQKFPKGNVISNTLEVEQKGNVLSGKSTLLVKNQGDQELSEIILYLNPALVVSAIKEGECLVGVTLGCIWGYVRKADRIFTEIYNIFVSVPTMIYMTLIALFIGQSFWVMCASIIFFHWMYMAKNVRNLVFIYRDREYNLASRCLGTRLSRVLTRNILPYLISVIILRVALSIPSTIGLETTLSYLGLGLDINIPSLGILLRNSRAFFLDYPYLLIFPAVIVSLVTITFYLAGNAFSDAADPRNHV